MVYKTCSIDRIIGQIYRDFKPSHSGWIDDAVEWIGDAIEIMKVHQGFVQTHKEVEVIDGRAKLPCQLENLLGVEHNNMRLPRLNGINLSKKCSCLDNLVCAPKSRGYTLNPNYIMTHHIHKGCITIHYEGLELDCNGFPTIPDEPFYRQALTWFVLSMMCLRGFKHQTVTYELADAKWNQTYPKAQNACNFPDIDSYDVFKKSWTGLTGHTNFTNQFFNLRSSTTGDFNSESLPPGSLVETFPILGTNLNND